MGNDLKHDRAYAVHVISDQTLGISAQLFSMCAILSGREHWQMEQRDP